MTKTPKTRSPKAGEKLLHVSIPDEQKEALRVKAFHTRTTIRELVIQALYDAGYPPKTKAEEDADE